MVYFLMPIMKIPGNILFLPNSLSGIIIVRYSRLICLIFFRICDECGDCKRAIDRAGFAIIATGLEQCLKSEDPTADRADMEKLFLSLA